MTSRLPIDIRRFAWINRLASDYAFDYARLSEFFAGNPAEPAAWREAIARVQRHQRPREAVADVVSAQQQRRNAPSAARAAAAQLRDPGTVAVVTGQQAGLLGGPLFTLLKALTAVKLAERVRRDHGVPAVAIFWIDAEDHDWDEVKAVGLLDADLNLHHPSLGNPAGAHEGPVASVVLDDSVTQTLAAVEATLPATEFTADLLATLRGIYVPGVGMADAFGRWLESVLGPHGLVVFDASDRAAKPLMAGLFAREIEYPGDTARLAGESGAALRAGGYHAQVTPQESSVALFHLNGAREPIRHRDGRYAWGDESCSLPELLAQVRQAPHQFSPNVLLRPLAQDTLFPTVCFVAGPSELAYHAQLGGVYDAFGLPRPLVQQRASATLLDANAMRFLARHDFALESLQPQDEAALNLLLKSQLPPAVEATLEDAARVVEERMEALAAAVPQIDATLEAAARSTLSRMQDDLRKLHAKIIQACKRKDETLRRQFTHAQAQAFPGGHPQEREIGFIYFLNKYGPGLVDRLGDGMPLEMGHHWVISI